MEFQILDVDYVMVNERPVLRIFGKDMEGKSVCGFYEGFLPYFYAASDDINESLEGLPSIHGVEKVKRTLPMGYQEPRDVWKITLKNPAKTVEVREALKKKGISTYEADILFKYRWMNDSDIGGMRWISTKESNGINTTSVSAQRLVQMKEFEIIDTEEDAPLRYLAFDIETVGKNEGSMPDSETDPVALISLVFSDDYRRTKSIILSTRPGDGIEALSSEKDMLIRFMEIINEYDADVLTGFNIVGYDLPYILKRMEKNNIRPVFGRCKTKSVRDDVFAGRHKITITGRIIADSFSMIKKGWNLKRYGLDFVSKALIGEEKKDVKKSEIGKFWRGSQEKYQILADYCLQDSILALKLLTKLDLMDKYIALSKISGSLLNDVLEGGESQRIENYYLKVFNKEGFIIPSKNNEQIAERTNGNGDDESKDLKGGFVIEPKKGLHSMVLVLDFKSMYPSLIRTYNICPTTLLIGNENVEHITTPNGSMFVKPGVRRGVIPSILENLMEERSKVKKMVRNADEKTRKMLDLKQFAIKTLANAFYGYFGYTRAKIYNVAIASSVTAFGRETIHSTVKAMEEDFGYEVVYGDTDSVMIKVPTESMEEAEKIGKDIGKKMTERLPGIMELEFEKLFKRFLPLTKKRYMGWSMFRDKTGEWKDDIVMKGIETVRRDWCELTGETMKEIIEIILKKNDTKAAVSYFKDVVKGLLDGDVDLEKLVITKTLTRRPEKYAGVQPHVEVVKKMEKRNDMDLPGVGDRIGYVIVKGMELLSKRAEDPNFVRENGLSIDSKYYIDNQLLPPLERIFTAIGISRDELLGAGKQMGLFEVISNSKNICAEPVTKGKLSDVNGFICMSCGMKTARPPLSGKCSCGGSLKFSTPEGPVSVAVS